MFEVFFLTLSAATGLFVTGAVLRNWKYGVALLLIWLLVVDLIRKLISGDNIGIILIIDLIYVLTLFSYLHTKIKSKEKIWIFPFSPSLFFLAVFLTISFLNPRSLGLLESAVGLRGYLFFVPLAFLGTDLFENKNNLFKWIRRASYVAVPLFLTALLPLIFEGLDLFMPLSRSWQFHGFSGGRVPKISSLFGTAQRFGMVSLLLLFLSETSLLMNYVPQIKLPTQKKWLMVSAFSAFGSIVLSASNVAFVLAIVGSLLIFFVGAYYTDLLPSYKFKPLLAGVFLAVLIFSMLSPLISYNLLSYQFNSFNRTLFNRIPEFIMEIQTALVEVPFWGFGIGSMSQGVRYIQESELFGPKLLDGLGETGFVKIIVELGILGLILFYFFVYEVIKSLYENLLKVDSSLKIAALPFITFFLSLMVRFTFVHHQVLGDTLTLVLMWLSIGIALGVSNLKIKSDRT